MKKIQLQYVAVSAILLWLIWAIAIFPGYADDQKCWISWAEGIRKNGLGNVYDTGTNYLPVYHYVLWCFAGLAKNYQFLIVNVFWLRYLTLLVDIAGIWLVYRWTDRKISFSVILLVSLANLAYVYDTVIFGQVDGILATLAFAALYCVYERRPLWAALWLCLLVNFKLQGIVFVPVYGLVLLARYELRQWPKVILQSICVLLLVQSILLLPFMFKTGGLTQVYNTLHNLVGFYPKVSSLAFNWWSFVLGSGADTTSDQQYWFAGLSYKHAGLLLFAAGSLLTCWPLLHYIYQKRIQRKEVYLPKEQVWLIAALVALLFFYFNTQMHERYSYPAFIFIAAYSFFRKDFIPYILFSFAFFMNMEFVLRWLQLDDYKTAIFDRRLISAVYGMTILYLWYRLYTSFNQSKKPAEHTAPAS